VAIDGGLLYTNLAVRASADGAELGGMDMYGGFIMEGLLQPTHLIFILLIVLILSDLASFLSLAKVLEGNSRVQGCPAGWHGIDP